MDNRFRGHIPESILRLQKLENLYVTDVSECFRYVDHNIDLNGNIEPQCRMNM